MNGRLGKMRRRWRQVWYHRWPQVRWWSHFVLGIGWLRRWRQRLAWASAPAPPGGTPGQPPSVQVVPGAVHVHTTYSDGLGTVPQVVAAARKAGLRFVVLSDHDTLQAMADGWEGYHERCLVLVGTEVRVHEGHLLALNLPPEYRFQLTHAQPQVERIQAAGGLAFFLPDEDDHFPWAKLRQLPVNGMEVVNLHNLALQSASLPAIAAFTLRYFLRGPMAAFGLLAARPDGDIAVWDRLGQERPLAGIASVDAHSRITLGRRRDLKIPTYEQSFRLVQTHLLIPGGFTGDAAHDRELAYAALGEGRAHLVLGDDPRARQIRFWCESGDQRALPGERVEARTDTTFHATSPVRRTLFRLYRDGRPLEQVEGSTARFACPGPGLYRLEVYRRKGRVGFVRLGVTPWLFTNCIQVR